MATVSANELSLEKTLEELITEFNSLRGDVSAVTLDTLLTSTSGILTFEGATADAYETSLVVVDPTADRTITLPNVTGTVVTTANADAGATTTTIGDLDYFLIDDGEDYPIIYNGLNDMDISFYINHSDTPNIESVVRDDNDLLEFRTIRKIKKGEELLLNYKAI